MDVAQEFRNIARLVEDSRRSTEQLAELRYWTEIGKAARDLLNQAGRERAHAAKRAHADGMSLTTISKATDLSVTRVAQLIARADEIEGDDK